jgi:hypothetical protein
MARRPARAERLRFGAWLALLSVWAAEPAPTRAQSPEVKHISKVEISGIERTRPSTLTDLLPRQPPAFYSDAELRELERRISNLEVFDEVAVDRTVPDTLRIRAREKWTLIPQLDLSGGRSLEDMYVFLGATEYNVLGTANSLNVSVYRERRGFGFYTAFQEHVYRRERWAFSGEASYATSELRFPGGEGWFNTLTQIYLWTSSKPFLSDYLRYETGLLYRREVIEEASGAVKPPNGHTLGTWMMFTWDAYQWHDLTPTGLRVGLSLSPAYFFSSGVPRVRAQLDFELKGALKLAQYTALMLRVEAGVTSRGNANHNVLIGSIRGVRGLPDALYFNWAQLYGTLELRQAVRLATRWALQGAVFADGAVYENITATGGRGDRHAAFSAGIGLRVVPTWLSGLVLRFDLAHLFVPEAVWAFQYGLSQYF